MHKRLLSPSIIYKFFGSFMSKLVPRDLLLFLVFLFRRRLLQRSLHILAQMNYIRGPLVELETERWEICSDVLLIDLLVNISISKHGIWSGLFSNGVEHTG